MHTQQTKCFKGLKSKPVAVPVDAVRERRTMTMHSEISETPRTKVERRQ